MGGNRKILQANRKRKNSNTVSENDPKKKKPNQQQQNQKKEQNQKSPQKTKKSTVPQLLPIPSKKVRSHQPKEKSTSTTTTKDKILASKKLSESMKCPSTSTSNNNNNNKRGKDDSNKSLINKRTKLHGKNKSIPLPSSTSTVSIPPPSLTKISSSSPGVELKLKTKDFKIPKKSKTSNTVVDSSSISSSTSLQKTTTTASPISFPAKTSLDVEVCLTPSKLSSKLSSKSFPSTFSSPTSSIITSASSTSGSTSSLILEHASGAPTISTISKNETLGIPVDDEEMDWEDFCIKRDELTSLWPNEPSNDGPSSLEFGGDEMEIDSYEPLIIVPDTNIWIGALSLIRELLDTKFKYYAYPTIIIPWMVLQELDVQGKNYRGPSRQSIIYIHKLLSSKHPRVRGQKASDACIDVPNFDRLNADDSIIQCAQQQKQNNPSAVVILLTNDINMMNKALVNDILGVDSKSGIQAFSDILNKESNNSGGGNNSSSSSFLTTVVPPNFNFNRVLEVSNNNQTSAQFKSQSNFIPSLGTNTTPTTVTGVTQTNTATHILPKLGQKRSRSPQPMLISNESKKYKFPSDTSQQPEEECEIKSFQEVLELIRKVFSHIIVTKMKEDFGETGWLNAVKVKPPWSIRSATHCIVKHWLAVFCEVFGRRSSQAEKLEELLKQHEQGRTGPEKEEEIIESVLGLFTSGEFAQCPLVKTDSKIRSCRQALLVYNKRYSNNNKDMMT